VDVNVTADDRIRQAILAGATEIPCEFNVVLARSLVDRLAALEAWADALGSDVLRSLMANPSYNWGPIAHEEWVRWEHARLLALNEKYLAFPNPPAPPGLAYDRQPKGEHRQVPTGIELQAVTAVAAHLRPEEKVGVEVGVYRRTDGEHEIRLPELLVEVRTPDGSPKHLVFGFSQWVVLQIKAAEGVTPPPPPVPADDRFAACWYAPNEMSFHLAPASPVRVSLYLLDWDGHGGGRSQRVEVVDAATGAVVDARDVSAFGGGVYLGWDVAEAVRFRIVNLNPAANAVASGVFLDPAGEGETAFAGEDRATQGTWRGRYGELGYSLAGGPTELPPGTTLAVNGAATYQWEASTTDPRALQRMVAAVGAAYLDGPHDDDGERAG
jgi:hypothetical protein